MKISIFKNSYNVWVDYGKRKDCLWVFDITETKKDQIEKWCSYEIVSWKLIVSETTEYTEKIKTEANEKIREDKRIAIDNIATLSDQLNKMATEIYKLTEGSTNLETIENRKTFENIKTILNN